ncbi:AMP-binding enzyme [Mageeibacillus indolicus UPII9-5]|uniref:AMP-binding enzyme n=1 Tax=Mageeibacillus indolicus (strain UPII9-5) TaxID=699246 RepID=D3R0B2_MAGIU|nr:AMP-binding protein [Mageeibacillus indolicus]ADC91547.1 AMP-binding enzyme [Mageeibacillus indolicus UPII9-5]
MIYQKGIQHYNEPAYTDMRAMLKTLADKFGDWPAYGYHLTPKDATVNKTYSRLWQDVQELGTGLETMQLLAPHDHAAIIGENSYAWSLAHISIILNAAVSVPLDKNLAISELISLINRGRCRLLFCDQSYLKYRNELLAGCPTIQALIILHKPEEILNLTAEKQTEPAKVPLYTCGEIMAAGAGALATGNTTFATVHLDPHAAAGLFFTSGTTSDSKGVLLSQDNILQNFRNGVRSLYSRKGSRVLSILPLHHTFENTVGMFAQLSHHNCIYFNDGLRYFLSNMKEWKIQTILAVPLLLENIYKQINQKLDKTGKRKLINFMRHLSHLLLKCGIDLRRQIFRPILQQFGGELRLIIAGAAALDPKISIFFNDIGIDCMLGYGLTEAGPMLAANCQKMLRPGSVGQPLADHEIKIDNGLDYSDANHTGEILGRSKSIMLGYYENPAATAAAIDSDGWLHTGDVGYLDKDGCLYITGRVKSMIVHTNGKKVFPEELETILQHIDGIGAAFVWGEPNNRGTIDICAALQIDRNSLPVEIREKLKSAASAKTAAKAAEVVATSAKVDAAEAAGATGDNAASDPADAIIVDWLDKQIAAVNETTPQYKFIRYFLWCEKGMCLSTTLKVRRQLELERLHKFLAAKNCTIKDANRQKIEA